MSFFDDASLVMIPSGYKDQKVYSVKPTDGTGDLTFSRASSATRVQSNGLIEKVRTNLVLYSEQFNNASWPKLNSATVTANTSVAPDGTTTADTLTLTTNISSSIYQTITIVSQLTFSVYAKVASGTKNFRLRFDRPTAIESADFTATTTWQRFTFTATTTGSGNIYIINDSTGTAGDLIIWGAQLETGDIATDYIPTTTAAVSVGPVSGLPRLDYLGSTCPRLLLEPQRTNSARNGILTAATWDKSSLTVTAASGIAPTGFNEAYRVAPATSGTDRFFYDDGASAGYTASADYTNTIFAKASGLNFCYARFEIKGNTSSFAYFNLATGAVGSTVGAVPIVKSIENYGNGWYRIRVTGNMGTGIGGSNNVLFGVCDADGSTFATTSGSNGVLFYGPQSEQGSYPTSYIPTLGASVTRVADAASKSSISSLIGQTEGTLFAEFVVDSSSSPTMAFFVSAAGVFDNAIWIQQSASDSVIFRVFSGSSAQASITKTGLTNGQTVKVAGAYKANDFVLYVNGVQVGTDTSGSIPASLSQIEIGSYSEVGSPFNQNRPIKQTLLFKTRLTNAQLAELTA
jgi:hypothetical protein